MVEKKQPALGFPNVQAAFLCFSLVETQLSYRNFIEATLSDDLHPQRIHNQLKHIRMTATAGVIEVKRIVSDGVLGQQLDQLPRIECICQAHTVLPTRCRGRLKRVSEKFLYQYFKNGVLAKLILI